MQRNFKIIDKCSDVSFEMRDEHYEESTAGAETFDLVWDYKECDDHGHVLVAQELVQFGWEDPWPVYRCECNKVDILDHHVVMLAKQK